MTLKRVLECLPTIEKIARCRSNKRRADLLREAKNCIFFAISEISLNVLNGNIRVSSYRKKQLKPHSSKIRKIADRKISLPLRKKLIIQSGGFLSSLLIPSITLLADLVARRYLK